MPEKKQKLVKVRTQASDAMMKFKEEIHQTCTLDKFWNGIPGNPNENCNILDHLLRTALDKHFPVKLIKYCKYKHKKSQWISHGIIRSIKFRDKLYKRLRATPPTDNLFLTLKVNLQTYNRILKQCIRSAKKKYYETRFFKCKNDIKNTWKTIKEVLNSSANNDYPKYFLIDDLPCHEPHKIANAFNKYFVEIGPALASNITPPIDLSFQNFLTKNIPSTFTFQTVSEDYVLKIINELKPKTSRGVDNISNNLIKLIKFEIVKPLTMIINQCMNIGMFPDKMKIAKVLPIYKKGENTYFENYRPISILPSVSKVFERIIHNQLYNYFNDNNLFYENQYGFRKHHSTELAALDLIDRVTCAMDINQTPLSIFLDLSKAFDTLDHNILLHKLKFYGVQERSLELFKNYLCDRKQVVHYDEVTSENLVIKTGVPQGSILGPLLFIIYLNDLCYACNRFKPVIYADDTALSAVLENLDPTGQHIVNTINTELEQINNWFKLNKLSVNSAKTKAMLFHTVQKRVPDVPISIDGTIIDFVKEFKYLGVILDSHLTWKPHIKYVSKKVAQTNGVMIRMKRYLPPYILLTLYNSLILPYLSYGIMVWGAHSERLFKLQKQSVRTITNAKYNAHTEPLFKSLNLLKISDILLVQELKFFYKLENQLLPRNFLSMLNRNVDVHAYNTRYGHNLRAPQSKHSFAKNATRYKIPGTINSAPMSIKEKVYTHSLYGFTKYSKLYIISQYEATCYIPHCYICQRS